mmetsp:Transcript_22/g.74  ORF Transcript_22/g.74 Transcript_22/m.74 type:complete len:298 (+) Transcript_22:778-1671(+)
MSARSCTPALGPEAGSDARPPCVSSSAPPMRELLAPSSIAPKGLSRKGLAARASDQNTSADRPAVSAAAAKKNHLCTYTDQSRTSSFVLIRQQVGCLPTSSSSPGEPPRVMFGFVVGMRYLATSSTQRTWLTSTCQRLCMTCTRVCTCRNCRFSSASVASVCSLGCATALAGIHEARRRLPCSWSSCANDASRFSVPASSSPLGLPASPPTPRPLLTPPRPTLIPTPFPALRPTPARSRPYSSSGSVSKKRWISMMSTRMWFLSDAAADGDSRNMRSTSRAAARASATTVSSPTRAS